MTALHGRLARILKSRAEAGLWRQLHTIDSPPGTRVTLQGKVLLNFASNDYLGLAAHPQIANALSEAAARYGAGSTASHLICGHHRLHDELERALAQLTCRQAALLFSTGYMANLALLTVFAGHGDHIFQDRLNHASLLDAGLLSRARSSRFRHRDCLHLERLLVAARGAGEVERARLIAVESVYSMDGDRAPLPRLAAIAHSFGACLIVDEAHALGVFGERGGGGVLAEGLDSQQVPLIMGTLGKAFGVFGAFVAGDLEVIEALRQLARPYIYTTALPPALAAAALAALPLVHEESRRQALFARVKQFRAGAESLGLPLADSASPIQPVLLGEASRAEQIGAALARRGFWVGAIRPPTVPQGASRLRISLSAAHSSDEVEALLAALGQLCC